MTSTISVATMLRATVVRGARDYTNAPMTIPMPVTTVKIGLVTTVHFCSSDTIFCFHTCNVPRSVDT
jgi:hypothetical protein